MPAPLGAAPPPAPLPTSAASARPAPPAEQLARLRQSAGEFEAMALSELLQPMFRTVDAAHGPFGGGAGEATWRPLLVDQMAKAVARAGGVGIGEAVFQEMLRAQAQGEGGARDD